MKSNRILATVICLILGVIILADVGFSQPLNQVSMPAWARQAQTPMFKSCFWDSYTNYRNTYVFTKQQYNGAAWIDSAGTVYAQDNDSVNQSAHFRYPLLENLGLNAVFTPLRADQRSLLRSQDLGSLKVSPLKKSA